MCKPNTSVNPYKVNGHFINWIISGLTVFISCVTQAANIAYIHGDIAADGTLPSGDAVPYDQMLLDDDGNTGLTDFAALVESQGHTINQYYDQDTDLDAAFFSGIDVLIFGLHQKLWSGAEKNRLKNWIREGGGMFIYSDSASGGCFCEVGAQNPVGQTVTNNLIAEYGMQVTVDQANGTKAFRAGPAPTNSLMSDRPELEGEGVSPIAVSLNDQTVEILIPYNDGPENFVSGNDALPHTQNISINNPVYAALALKTLNQGHIAVMFDRQPMWNNGPGSSINQRDNKEILRRLMNFLAQRPTVPNNPPKPRPNSNVVPAIILLLDESLAAR